MGTQYSTEPLSKCEKYLSLGKFDENTHTWVVNSSIFGKINGGPGDHILKELTPIMIGKKNYRGEDNISNNAAYWEFMPDKCRLIDIIWEDGIPTPTFSIQNGDKIFKTNYDKGDGIRRLAIHNEAFNDYIENGPEGKLFMEIAKELSEFRVPIEKS